MPLNTLSKLTYLCLLITGLSACSRSVKQENGYTVLKGKFKGDKYEIAYDSTIDLGATLDSIIQQQIDLLSVYNPNSLSGHFNGNKPLDEAQQRFYKDHETIFVQFDSFSIQLKQASHGKFNPGLCALEKYWKNYFDQGDKETWDPRITDTLKTLDFGNSIAFMNGAPVKSHKQMQVYLDAALAGIVADHLAKRFIEVYKFKNFYINIAGTIRSKGNNGKDSYWPIKIEKPMINTQKVVDFATVPLKNYALSTKTNFKKFHFIKGHRYSLALDAIKGFPAKNELLSVSIWAPGGMEAELTTAACLSMGLEEAKTYIVSRPELKAFLIFERNEQLEFWASANLSYELNLKD